MHFQFSRRKFYKNERLSLLLANSRPRMYRRGRRPRRRESSRECPRDDKDLPSQQALTSTTPRSASWPRSCVFTDKWNKLPRGHNSAWREIPEARGSMELVASLTFAIGQESRGTPREAGRPWTKGKARTATVRSFPMVVTSDKHCRCLTSEWREVIS